MIWPTYKLLPRQRVANEGPRARATGPEVFVVVLNWNGWRDTIECLESLQQLDYPDYRMVVVDNGSSGSSETCPKPNCNGASFEVCRSW